MGSEKKSSGSKQTTGGAYPAPPRPPPPPLTGRPGGGENMHPTGGKAPRHWMSIYADLLEFKRGILARVQHDIATLSPPAQKAASTDLEIIETQMEGYQE